MRRARPDDLEGPLRHRPLGLAARPPLGIAARPPLGLRVVDLDVQSPPSADAAATEQREFVTRPGVPELVAVAR